MRKLRISIFDDDVTTLEMLKIFMSQRDYEILLFDRPVVCPINSGKADKCNNFLNPCADIIMTDYQMPGMTGTEMLLHQAQMGCKVDIRNKLVMSGNIDGKGQEMIEELGCAFFNKPFRFNELIAWLGNCEKRIDLSKPLGTIRKEYRHPSNIDIVYEYNNDKTYQATVINYSNSGLCLKVGTPPAEKQPIVIKTGLPINFNNTSIQWVKEMSPDLYLAGCSCC